MTTRLIDGVRWCAYPLTGAAADYDPLVERVGKARFVRLGEASHGTHEFYRERAEITKQLITEKTFTAVVVEEDWTDAYHVARYVRGVGNGQNAVDALAGFKRFPAWMWRNVDVLHFLNWLRAHNDALSGSAHRVGFYGPDLYSLRSSIAEVLAYLQKLDAQAAQRARYRYVCFDHFGEDPQAYGYAASVDLSASCESEVINQLVELRTAQEDAKHQLTI